MLQALYVFPIIGNFAADFTARLRAFRQAGLERMPERDGKSRLPKGPKAAIP